MSNQLDPIGLFTSKCKGANTLVDSAPQTMDLSFRRFPYWKSIPHPVCDSFPLPEEDGEDPETIFVNMIPIHNSFSFTINFDPDCADYRNKSRPQIASLMHIFLKMQDQGVLKRLVFVYEHGKSGKIHHHGVIQFNNGYTKKEERVKYFESPIISQFNVKRNAVHRTLQYYKIKDARHRGRQYAYMMKEEHNRYNATYYI